jgi:flagellar hook protein FlgE
MSNYSISLSGLQSTSKALDTVSNNIANSGTIGYKAGEYAFADMFVRAINPANQSRVGLGVSNTMVRRPNVQGTIVASSNQLDLAINGQGMFRLLQASGVQGSVDPSSVYYTRNGQFMVDRDGYIVNSNGMFLTGFQPTGDKQGITDDLIANNGLLRIPEVNLPGMGTTDSKIYTQLDSRLAAFTPASGVAFDPFQNTYNNKTTQTVFDVEGNPHTLELYYRRVADSQLQIRDTLDGYTYPPSSSASPTTPGVQQIILNPGSVLLVDSAPVFSASASEAVVAGAAQPILLNATDTALVKEGMRVYVNGIDTGRTVASDGSLGVAEVEIDGLPLNVAQGAVISFYPAYIEDVADGAGTLETTLTVVTADQNVVGYRVFVAGIDSGVNVLEVDGNDLLLDGGLTWSDGDEIEFRAVLNMTMTIPDGTRLSLQGTTNKKASETILETNMATVMVYASLDGVFYDHSDINSFSNRQISEAELGVQNGYRAVSQLSFIAGRNIDSFPKDPLSGNPIFQTTTQLSSAVVNQAGGRSNLVFELDLTNTTLQAGAFQVTRNIQNGEPVSRLTNVSVDSQGRIVATYGTGKQLFVGQVALVHFDAFEELIPVGNNAFAASVRSGTEQSADGVIVGKAGTGIFGDIKAQALESSNVDLANELVRLLVLQRSYTANSQGLRAFDSTLQDTLRILG